MAIATDRFSEQLRRRAIDLENRRVLITDFSGSLQAQDLTEPSNCSGVGRIRHFRRMSSTGWSENPLPIEPANKALGTTERDVLRAQVFQNAACNWRCWYCFVDFPLLSADPRRSRWLSASELLDLYLGEPNRPLVIDLTGGQPDLVPEWPVWMLDELNVRGLSETVYIWSDDNLSNDYFWRFLTDEQREMLASAAYYGKVGCFKGFNSFSFAFNTGAEPQLFDRQFELMERLLQLGLDQYAYVTFTAPESEDIADDISIFVDRLQRLDHNLPLRTVPLEIQEFTPVTGRMSQSPQLYAAALANQWRALDAWHDELARRFSRADLETNIADIPLRERGSR